MSTASSIWARGELCCQLPQVNQQGSPDSPMLMTEAFPDSQMSILCFTDSPILCPKARDHPPDKMIPYDTIIHRNFWMKFNEHGWKRTNLFIIYNYIYNYIYTYDYLIWLFDIFWYDIPARSCQDTYQTLGMEPSGTRKLEEYIGEYYRHRF
jgi:hypothetical protein